MRKSNLPLAIVTISILAGVRVVCAQEPSIARLVYFTAQAGTRAQVEDAIKKQMDWRREQKDSWRWLTWEYASGEVPRYCVATFGHGWADFDGMPLAGRAEEAGGGLASALSATPPAVQYFEHLDEVSDFGNQTNTPTLAEISVYQLHYGKKAQFYAARSSSISFLTINMSRAMADSCSLLNCCCARARRPFGDSSSST